MDKYYLHSNDAQYVSCIYICAVPGLFDVINDKEVHAKHFPAFNAMKYSDKEGRHIPSHPELTGSTRALLEFALSCFNGYKIGIDDVIGTISSNEFFQSFNSSNGD